MLFGSVCSGIEAASLGWESLGWKAKFYSEIDKFPSAVLDYRFPEVPNLGDMTQITKTETFKNGSNLDILVGGTPCQSFSYSGLRSGLNDERGNLALEFIKILVESGSRWFVWENVAGVLSSNGGRDFACMLGGFQKLGYCCAWRVLDAQYFGVPQQRRRVFLVGYIGDWRPPVSVLFDAVSLQGDFKSSGKKRKKPRSDALQSFAGDKRSEIASTIQTTCHDYSRSDNFLTVIHGTQDPDVFVEKAHTLGRNQGQENAIFQQNSRDEVRYIAGDGQLAGALTADPGVKQKNYLHSGYNLRRLTPRECERLQGFPDDFTLIPYRGKLAENCPDSPRYKAIGNSMAVPVMRWIGERIDKVDEIISSL